MKNIVRTKLKTPYEYDQFEDWIDEHCMSVSYLGNREYVVDGDEDFLLFKMVWGE